MGYIFYVLSVVAREVYKKWKANKQQNEEENSNNASSAEQSSRQSFSDRMMPMIGAYAFEEPLTDFLNLSQPKNEKMIPSLPTILSSKEVIFMDDLSQPNNTQKNKKFEFDAS